MVDYGVIKVLNQMANLHLHAVLAASKFNFSKFLLKGILAFHKILHLKELLSMLIQCHMCMFVWVYVCVFVCIVHFVYGMLKCTYLHNYIDNQDGCAQLSCLAIHADKHIIKII